MDTSKRRGYSLVELTVVSVLAMALVSSVTLSMSMVPSWFQRIDDRLGVLRETQVTRAIFLLDLKNAKTVTCLAADSVKIKRSDDKEVTYTLQDSTISSEWKDLLRQQDAAQPVKISTFLTSLNCSTTNCSGEDQCADICLVLKKGAAVRRCQIVCRPAVAAP